MRYHFRIVLGSLIGITIVMILLLAFHLGGPSFLPVARLCALVGPLVAGALCLVSVNMPIRQQENVEPWLRRERLAWTLMGCGYIGWAIGESFWRYYSLHGQSPFPSLADAGFSSFNPLVFAGLLLLPSSKNSDKRLFLILDSLIAMGAMLSIAWFLLLGSLAQTPNESVLAKFLGLYYPVADIALLSCIIFLLLRGPAQVLTYLLLVILFVVLGFNVLSSDKTQQSIRPVLLIATLIVIGLVIVRQIMTMQENDGLMKAQVNTLKKLEKVYHDVENRKVELEE